MNKLLSLAIIFSISFNLSMLDASESRTSPTFLRPYVVLFQGQALTMRSRFSGRVIPSTLKYGLHTFFISFQPPNWKKSVFRLSSVKISGIGVVLVSVDIISKSIARYSPPYINFPFGFEPRHVENNNTLPVFTTLCSIIILSLILHVLQKTKLPRILTWGLLLTISGVAGNLVDGILFSSVTDWLAWYGGHGTVAHWFGLGGGTIFNLADVFLISGRVLFFLGLLRWLYQIILLFSDDSGRSSQMLSTRGPSNSPPNVLTLKAA
jgi:hypothetical protein